MKVETIYSITNVKKKKELNLSSYETYLLNATIWVVEVWDFQFYYDDGYVLAFHGEYTNEDDAREEFAWMMNEYEIYN